MNVRLIIYTSVFFLQGQVLWAQSTNAEFVGTYADGYGDNPVTELSLMNDGSFRLKSPDPIFPYTHIHYENTGNWTKKGNEITLNPGKKPRKREIELIEKNTGTLDSITIKINYSIKVFENEQFTSESSFDFDQMTLYLNNGRRHYNLVRHQIRRGCMFSSQVKNQIIVDSRNRFKIAKVEVKKLSIITYGFDDPYELVVSNPGSNYFEINIVQPVDKERAPRSKKVRIIDGVAYFYERNGKVDISWMANGLAKKNK